MRILVTNDDGILSEALWLLVKELKSIAEVTVVAPDREQSAIGTAVTLRQTLRVQKVRPLLPEVEAYSVEGTPSDSVILALGQPVKCKIDLVISGINQGPNLGEDVHISGTVAAALQAFFRGYSAIAISAPYKNGQYLETAARVAALLATKITADPRLENILLNVNLPELILEKINGVKLTKLASESHINTVEEGDDGRRKYYWLVRQRAVKSIDNGTDIWAIDNGHVSITPLHLDRPPRPPLLLLNRMCSDLFRELQSCVNQACK